MWKFKLNGDETVITPPSSINYDTLEEFKELMSVLSNKNCVNVVIDMRNTVYIDSSGLGMIVKAANDFESFGGKFKLNNVNSVISEILKITNLHKIIDIN